MWKGLGAFLAVTVGLTGSAHAYLKAGPAGYGHWLKSATVQDGMATGLAAAYSFRKVRSAYAGPAIKLRRATGGTQDIGFTAGGDFDTAAAATFCAATSCFIDTWYDQSTNARHVTQATAGNQPAYVPDCIGVLPCMRASAASAYLQGGPITPASGVMTLNVVARTDSAAATCTVVQADGASLGPWSGGSAWLAYNGGSFTVPAAHGAWHSGTLVINGASSLINLDAIETLGALTPGVVSSGAIILGGGAANPCSTAEAIWWDNYQLTPAERAALVNNQKDYWTPLPLDNFATPAAAYSFRRLKSTYSGPAIRLRRASDNAEADIPFLGYTSFTGAPIDTAAANAHCTSPCTVVTWYDQSGNARHATQGTPANQPLFVFNCRGTLPCFRFSSHSLISGPQVTPLAATSYSAVGRSDSAPATCAFIVAGAQQLTSFGGSAHWGFWNGAGLFAPAAHGQWHAGNGVISGASSVMNIDGVDTAVPLAAVTTPDWLWTPATAGAGPDCSMAEAVYWNGYPLTAGERVALSANQRGFWGF